MRLRLDHGGMKGASGGGSPVGLDRLRCALFGHDVRDVRIAPATHCRCGATILERGRVTRIAHVVSCFVGGHRYRATGAVRAGRHELTCVRCGHPLLVARPPDGELVKRVRYACNLLGHRVEHLAARSGWHEYACRCGHSFLKRAAGLRDIRHPVDCLVRGHYVEWVGDRDGVRELVCRVCGHPFCVPVA